MRDTFFVTPLYMILFRNVYHCIKIKEYIPGYKIYVQNQI